MTDYACTNAQSLQSCLTLLQPQWSVARIPLSMGFSGQEYWSGSPYSSPGDIPNPGIKPMSLTSTTLAGSLFSASAIWEACTAVSVYPYSVWEGMTQEREYQETRLPGGLHGSWLVRPVSAWYHFQKSHQFHIQKR